MQSQNGIPIISKSIEHFNSEPFDWDMQEVNLIMMGVYVKWEARDRLDALSEQIDSRITLRSAMFWIKQQRLQIEVLGKIIVE